MIEAGFQQGDSLVIWVDGTNCAESVVAQLGSIKAGVEIVTFDEVLSAEALHHALTTTGAKGLLFSPDG